MSLGISLSNEPQYESVWWEWPLWWTELYHNNSACYRLGGLIGQSKSMSYCHLYKTDWPLIFISGCDHKCYSCKAKWCQISKFLLPMTLSLHFTQKLNPALSSCYFCLTLKPHYCLEVAIEITPPFSVSEAQYHLPFLWFRSIMCTHNGHHHLPSPVKANLTIANESLGQTTTLTNLMYCMVILN